MLSPTERVDLIAGNAVSCTSVGEFIPGVPRYDLVLFSDFGSITLDSCLTTNPFKPKINSFSSFNGVSPN